MTEYVIMVLMTGKDIKKVMLHLFPKMIWITQF